MCVCVCLSSYTCAKPQESLHWPGLMHTDRTSLTVPLKNHFVYILEAMHFFFKLPPERVGGRFFYFIFRSVFFVPGYIFCFEDCGTITEVMILFRFVFGWVI